jgi:hypothetical protein
MRFSIPAIRLFQVLRQPAFFSRQTSWLSHRGAERGADGQPWRQRPQWRCSVRHDETVRCA